MRRWRLFRIFTIGASVPILFAVSQEVARARGQEPAPGLVAALAVLAGLLLVRAYMNERTRGPEFYWYNDLEWGLAVGAASAVGLRFLGWV
ncbi:hypothetical protein HRbin30_02535 [bacterium HR30]|nr:hypothetical protein HRbin30_02535 [bacterium HR30]